MHRQASPYDSNGIVHYMPASNQRADRKRNVRSLPLHAILLNAFETATPTKLAITVAALAGAAGLVTTIATHPQQTAELACNLINDECVSVQPSKNGYATIPATTYAPQ